MDGVLLQGRYIEPAAYAAYLRAAELEARGQPRAALGAYRAATDIDPTSPEIWTRVGALRCAGGDVAGAAQAFAEAGERDGAYAPLWSARARCHDRRGDQTAALRAARRAASLDSDDVEAVLRLVALLDARGRTREAGRWLRALSLEHRDVLAVWQAVQQHARRVGDQPWQRQAAREARRLRARWRPLRPAAASKSWQHIDEALQAGQLEVARRTARRQRLDERWLPARALLLGRPGLALQQSSLRVEADPADSDARLLAALAADLLGERGRLTELLAGVPPSARPPGVLGRLALAELMERHLSRAPAELELGDPSGAADGPLGDIAARMRRRIEPGGARR